jgi:hypothetical protein
MEGFKSFYESKMLQEDNDLILEFANMSPAMHNFGVDVKLYIFQPGDKQLSHGPRIKVFKPKVSGDFSITLEEQPRVIGDYKNIVTTSELNKLITNIKKYRTAFIQFWNDSQMDTNELINLFQQIDRKFDIGE